MAEEIILINKSKGRFTINFQGAFPQNKFAERDGKMYLSEKEFDFVKNNYPHVLEGESKRLYLDSEELPKTENEDLKAFFAQHHTKIKSAISQMDAEEANTKLSYAELHDVSENIVKALGNRVIELDKQGK